MSVRRRARAIVGIAAALTGVLASCSGPTRFLDPEADLPYYQKVAIVPFTSLAQDRAGGAKVTDIFFTELLRARRSEVVDPGQFAAAMARIRGGTPPESPWSTEDLARLGEATGAQGFFFGTVRDYEMLRTGQDSYPHLSLEARFVDAATGRVVWSASRTKRGGPGVPLVGWLAGIFGAGETHTLGELAADVCRDLLATLPEAR
jgi:TolB-like protein